MLRKTGNETDQLPEYDLKFERILNVMGRNHMNGMALIPEVCFTPSAQQRADVASKKEYQRNCNKTISDMGRNHMNGMALIQEVCFTPAAQQITDVSSRKEYQRNCNQTIFDALSEEKKLTILSLANSVKNLTENFVIVQSNDELFKVKVLSFLSDIADNIKKLSN